MYWLMSIDAIIRIAFAIAFLFVIVPALAWPGPRVIPSGARNLGGWGGTSSRPSPRSLPFDFAQGRDDTFLERLFWNLGVGITLLTVVGQILTLANLVSLATLLLVAGLILLLGRSTYRRIPPWTLVRQSAETTFLALLNIFDRRVNVLRRIRRWYRRTIAALRQKTESRAVRMQIAGWMALTAIAAGFRLYRPLASANLGYSDTYVHLYLVKLLEEGQQVDPQWGPYPRGLHFLLMAIHQLTNVDEILLMNYFGVFVGVLITLAVADTARRLSGSLVSGLLAGFFFATLVGGPSQYFVLGGAFATRDRSLAASLSVLPYRELTRTAGEFDIVLTAFQRQTSTLSQELAMALLFPAAMFLLDFFRKRDRWHLIGFAGCTAAIAAVHSGVVVPLVLMCALMLLAVAAGRALAPGTARKAVMAGAAAVLVGSAWAIAFIAYPYAGGISHTSLRTSVARAAFYYFPILRPMAGDVAGVAGVGTRVFVALTPFLIACILLAIGLIVFSFTRRDDFRVNRIWISSIFLLFLLMHFASILGLPQIVPTTRNSQWLLMSMVILMGVAIVDIASLIRFIPKVRVATTAVVLVPLLLLWTSRVPRLSDPPIHDRIVDYSGYGGSALAVLRIERSFEPYTWTLVSYGQEFPMVLRRGFHLPAADFLERYDPSATVTPIPTPHVFVIVEKTPHRFQIDTWALRFGRSELEQRLQTWVHLYQATHKNLRVFLEDEHVRVYQIERTPEEIERMVRQARQ